MRMINNEIIVNTEMNDAGVFVSLARKYLAEGKYAEAENERRKAERHYEDAKSALTATDPIPPRLVELRNELDLIESEIRAYAGPQHRT